MQSIGTFRLALLSFKTNVESEKISCGGKKFKTFCTHLHCKRRTPLHVPSKSADAIGKKSSS